MTFQPLRGFRDYPAPDAGARSELRRKMRAVARRSGFQELETPSVESLELFKVKSGEEIGQQVWAFTDKGGREVALLPETTPSLARIFVDRAKSEPMPVKWFTLSKLWRYEEPQQGRTREFGQFNLDILGVPGIEAEVELLATAALLLDEVGARGLYAFRINDRGLAEGLGAHFGVTQPERFLHVLDRFRKLSGSEFHRELREAGVPEAAATELSQLLSAAGPGVPAAQADDLLDRISTLGLPEPGPSAIARLRALVQLVSSAGFADRVVLDPSVARGLAYYTSTVFEAYDLSGDLRALFGGGRYDHLIGLFGGLRPRRRGPDVGAAPAGEEPLAPGRAGPRHLRRRGHGERGPPRHRDHPPAAPGGALRRHGPARPLHVPPAEGGGPSPGPSGAAHRPPGGREGDRYGAGSRNGAADGAAFGLGARTGVIPSIVGASQRRIPGGDSAPSTNPYQ